MAKKSNKDEQDGRLIKALCAMKENDISVKILKPLFEAMGWDRVEFYGGPYERGIDLIAQRKLPPRANNYVLVAQTKKIGGLGSHETSRLVHQLRQACTALINAEPGSRVIPDEVYLACPERIPSRLLDELASQLESLTPRIHIYDGPQIIQHIKQHKPDLLNELGSLHDRLVALDEPSFRNQELLDALSSQSCVEIKDFYSDLSFFVGSIDSNILLHLEVSPGLDSIRVSAAAWPSVRQQIEQMQEKYSLALSCQPLLEIENRFNLETEEFQSKENVRNRAMLKEAGGKADELLISTRNLLRDVEGQYALDTAKADPTTPLILDALSRIRVTLQGKLPFSDPQAVPEMPQPCPAILQSLFERIAELARLNERVATLGRLVRHEPTYNVNYSYSQVSQAITSRIERYLSDISRIDRREMSAPELRSFLRDTLTTLGCIAQLEQDSTELRKCIDFRNKPAEQDRISISPHDVFDSRENIAVYGGAGVGKTTTLKAYMDRSFRAGRRDIIYVPLNRISDKLFRISQSFHSLNSVEASSLSGGKTVSSKSTDKLTDWLSDRLLAKIILISRGLSYEEAEVSEAQALLEKGMTLILDGLDEAFDTIPQLVQAIIELNVTNRKTQLIISSRDCASYLRDIDFLGITLLPFTREQLNRFISGWFKNPDQSAKLMRAIDERGLFEHMRTPLLATIACALMEKGIETHSNEREIYGERIRLLTGTYDVQKKIKRQNNSSDLLQRVACRIAYEMHCKRVRSLPLKDLLVIASNSFADSHSAGLIEGCVKELINPCNILVMDRSISEYSFGHFRFQEHLAAEELRNKGRTALVDYVSSDWWRGALCIYAQDADIPELFEETYKANGNIRNAERTFREMIANSPRRRRRALSELLSHYIEADDVEELLLDVQLDEYADSVHESRGRQQDGWL